VVAGGAGALEWDGFYLLAALAGGLSRGALGWTAIFNRYFASNVFYSAYFIHVNAIVFFTLLTIGAAWRYHADEMVGLGGVGGVRVWD